MTELSNSNKVLPRLLIYRMATLEGGWAEGSIDLLDY
jgi:hypothetical protein